MQKFCEVWKAFKETVLRGKSIFKTRINQKDQFVDLICSCWIWCSTDGRAFTTFRAFRNSGWSSTPGAESSPSSPDPASTLEGVTVALRRSSKCPPDYILSWVWQHPITTVNTVECCFELLSRLTFAGTTLRQTESLIPWCHQTPPISEVFASATVRAALCLTFCHLSAVYGVPQANYTQENSFVNLKTPFTFGVPHLVMRLLPQQQRQPQ